MDTFDYKPELHRRARPAVRPGQPRRGPDQRAGQPDEEPVSVPAARRMRALGQQRVSRARRVRRRPGVPDGACVQDERARAGQLHDEHRLPDAGLSVHGGLALVWPGLACRTTCRRSSCCPTRRACPTTPRAISRRGSCPSRTRGRSSTPARRGRSPTCFRRVGRRSSRRRASATGRDVLERLNRMHAAANEGDSRLESRIAAYELAARMQQTCPGGARPRRRDAGDPALYGTGRPGDRRLRPPLPAGPAAARARRAVRAGLERRGRPDEQLGQPCATSPTSCRRSPAGRPADRRLAPRPEGPRPAGRHAGRLQHRVRPPAVHAGSDRPRPQRRHVGRLAGRRRRQGRRRRTAKATPGPGGPRPGRPTATTCTRRSCTCWASTTPGSRSATTASTAA